MDGFAIEGFQKHFNSVGRGKGIATYYRSCYELITEINQTQYQMTKIGNGNQDVINVYRSGGAASENFKMDLRGLFDRTKKTFLVGDLNICFKSESSHPVLVDIQNLGFQQKVENPTHMEGRQIDHVFFFSPIHIAGHKIEVKHKSPYFTDHDILSVSEVCLFHHLISIIPLLYSRLPMMLGNPGVT